MIKDTDWEYDVYDNIMYNSMTLDEKIAYVKEFIRTVKSIIRSGNDVCSFWKRKRKEAEEELEDLLAQKNPSIHRARTMFYRYEIKRISTQTGLNVPWENLCKALTPDHRRMIKRFLYEPKWYRDNPDKDSICWFTQYGYDKYHEYIEEIIKDCNDNYYPLKVRLLERRRLKDVVMHGKVQCICLK